MSIQDELYTKREYLDDLAAVDSILRTAREAVCDKQISGLQLVQIEELCAQTCKLIKARWAGMGRWFGALAKAKREWAKKQFGEHDHESYKKLAFLKAIVAQILEGSEQRVEREIAAVEGFGPWCRERTERDLKRGYMPDCAYEICTGGKWRPVQKHDLPDRVRWV